MKGLFERWVDDCAKHMGNKVEGIQITLVSEVANTKTSKTNKKRSISSDITQSESSEETYSNVTPLTEDVHDGANQPSTPTMNGTNENFTLFDQSSFRSQSKRSVSSDSTESESNWCSDIRVKDLVQLFEAKCQTQNTIMPSCMPCKEIQI